MPEMRALSVMQPWLHAIACLGKTVENHTWAPSRWAVGARIALHASKGFDYGAIFSGVPMPDELTRGAVVAVATIAGAHEFCHPLCSPWAALGQHHWLLTDVWVLPESVPSRGALGLWRLPAEVEHAVMDQLEVRADA